MEIISRCTVNIWAIAVSSQIQADICKIYLFHVIIDDTIPTSSERIWSCSTKITIYIWSN